MKRYEEYSTNKECKTLIVFNDRLACVLNNKKINPIVTELFIEGRKLNIPDIFIMQSYTAVIKNIRLNSRHYTITKIPNQQDLQEIANNHSSNINFKNFMNLYQ